jgi:hypothetical protein
LWRSRWAAIGAAVAVAVGAGGIYVSNAASGSTASSFVAITPVRVLDTRSDLGLTGLFTSPTARDLLVTGVIATSSGSQQVVPAGATAVVLNVTVVGPTAAGYLSVRPADAAGAPSTSSLNFGAGAVVPNAVTVQVPTSGGDAGKIEITYNAFDVAGPTTHVMVDIVGYYQANNGAATLVMGSFLFTADKPSIANRSGQCAEQDVDPWALQAGLTLPVGVTITRITAYVEDDGSISLYKSDDLTDSDVTLASGSSVGTPGRHRVEVPLATPELVEEGEYFNVEFHGGGVGRLCGAEIDYSIP